MSRPQVGIERLPARRPTNEPRESMNCKSYLQDAVPKKRGPKTDVLEALLKRVDGLEQKLKDQKKDGSGESGEGTDPNVAGAGSDNGGSGNGLSPGSEHSINASTSVPPASATTGNSASAEQPTSSSNNAQGTAEKDDLATDIYRHSLSNDNSGFTDTAMPDEAMHFSSHENKPEPVPPVHTVTLLHTYFTRSHAKPFHILDEASFRQRLQLNQIPSYLLGSTYSYQ
ncbi:fungal specific transcription factor [Ophiostoma piceae UAMH 11346]|uniref:Fungal specific transcription factor n=1 Tax=Ophiostoma piceae (strain UAMH 11346) TaxID=1262450 RepID=S3CAQ2_OPHP1|nr:fungal specific transcription factor [Ophiostoma piceae UAMH 11346]